MKWRKLLAPTQWSEKDPLTPAPLPQGGEGRVKLNLRPRPLGERVARNRRLHQPGRAG